MSIYLISFKHIKIPILWGSPSVYTGQQEGVCSAIGMTVTLDTAWTSSSAVPQQGTGFLRMHLQSSGISLAVTFTDAQASHKIPLPNHTVWFETGNLVDTGSLTRPPFYPDWICCLSVTGHTGRTAWLEDRPIPGSQAISLQSIFLTGSLSVVSLGMLQPQGVENFCPSDILWRLLQEKEGAFVTRIRKWLPVLSAGHWKAGQARDQNVDGRCQRHQRTQCHRGHCSNTFWFLPY